MTPTLRHRLWAVAGMLLGGPGVFGAVIALNEVANTLDRDAAREATALEIQRTPPPKKTPTVRRPKPKPRPKNPAPPPPSFEALTSGLAGVDVGLPALDLGMGGAGDALLGAASRDVAMTRETVDEVARPVRRPTMAFPPSLRRQGVQGYVVLSILVNVQGSVDAVKVVESSPPGVFDEHAVAGVRRWEFEPAQYKGEATKMWIRQRITFDLS